MISIPQNKIQTKTGEMITNVKKLRGFGGADVNIHKSEMGYRIFSVSPGQDIQKTIDRCAAAGGGKVFLKNGAHYPAADIILKQDVIIEGETSGGTIIDFGGSPYSIRIEGSDVYATGTASVNLNSVSITGTGTVWTINMVGQQIFLGGGLYNIVSVESSTALTIDFSYTPTGTTGNLVNGTYTIATTINYPDVRNFTVQNSAAEAFIINYCQVAIIYYINVFNCNYGIKGNYLFGVDINEEYFYGCNYGIYFTNSDGATFQTSTVQNTVIGHGISYVNSGDSTLFNFSAVNSGGNGINFDGAFNTSIIAGTVSGNTGKGIEMNATSSCVLNNITASFNGSDGVKFTANCDNNFITNCLNSGNTGYGINIANANCDTNIILGNNIYSNTAGQVTNSGTNTKIKSNIGVADGA